MKRLLPVAMVLLLLLTASAVGLWQQHQRFLQTPLRIDDAGLVLNVEAGASIRSVIGILEQNGVTHMDWHWRLLSRVQRATINTGEYRLSAGLLPKDLLSLLASAKVVAYRFTIIEGWSVKQLIETLGKDPVLVNTLSGIEGLHGLPAMPAGHPEGWFLPETYTFVRGDTDLQILQRAYNAMQIALKNTWAGRDTGLPYETAEELLIMASIIEKETSLASERSTIAGVFVRRLQKHWRLETDPTVIYGMGDAYDGDLRRKDMKQDTPYNTYTRHGLPPTPIALPGLAAIQAAAHPEAGEAMFFVANGQGGHTFSSTLEAHNKAVRALIRDTKSKAGNTP